MFLIIMTNVSAVFSLVEVGRAQERGRDSTIEKYLYGKMEILNQTDWSSCRKDFYQDQMIENLTLDMY